jgi:hypothetical protein
MADKNTLLAEHYQKTYELTYRLWQQRNRTFLMLIAVIAAGTLLMYRPTDANSLLVDWVAKLLDIKDSNRIKELRDSFPFALLQSILLTVIFYLMVNLFHRAVYVLRNYAYLGALEKEVRSALSLSDQDVAFTRESNFYWKDRPVLLSTVKGFYVFLLGLLLFAFLIGRVIGDILAGSVLLILADLAIAVPTAIYFLGYAWYTLQLDSKDAIIGDGRGSTTPAPKPAEEPNPELKVPISSDTELVSSAGERSLP